MVVNRFWTITSMRKPCRAAGGLHRRNVFYRSDNVIVRHRRCLRKFSAFVLLDIWPSKTGCLCDIQLMVDILETVWKKNRKKERVCFWIKIHFSKHEKKQCFKSRDIKSTTLRDIPLSTRYQEYHTSWHASQYPSPNSKRVVWCLWQCVCVGSRPAESPKSQKRRPGGKQAARESC